MKSFLLICIIIVLAFCISCDKENGIPNANIDYSYFPSDTGIWINYNITEINIDVAVNKYDTTNYQLKEYFESKFYDNEGNESIRIERFIRENENNSWEIKDVWYATLLTVSAQRIEENIRYVKLIFPVELNSSWNGNIYNIYSDDQPDYSYTSIDAPIIINSFNFDSVAIITQTDDESIFEKLYKTEKYAKNIGLIEKTLIDVYSNIFIDTSINIMDRITLGYIYKQEITDYGKN